MEEVFDELFLIYKIVKLHTDYIVLANCSILNEPLRSFTFILPWSRSKKNERILSVVRSAGFPSLSVPRS